MASLVETFLFSMILSGFAGLDSMPYGLELCNSTVRQNLNSHLSQLGASQQLIKDKLPTKECIVKLRGELGISPDLAFLECRERAINIELEAKTNRNRLCAQGIQGTPKVLKPVRQYRDGYLVDLGPYGFRTPETFWKEGGWWRKHGCIPLKEMEHWTKDNIETAQRHRWFRYGECSSQGVTLGVWSEDEALNYCERKAK